MRHCHFKRQCIRYNNPLPISVSTDCDSFFWGYSPRLQDQGFDIIVCVFVVGTRARRGKFRVQALWDASLMRVLMCLCAQKSPELGSFTSFSVCMFKVWLVSVRSDAGGGEGELAVRETQLSACAPNTVQLYRVLCLNALNSLNVYIGKA